ncbi:Subfamily S9B unassigned peptidase (S09 family) [Fasciola hepatica]|uniref:Subfamily S9B unassigned peptidase (S09 family) n=1 Tax=Fasciola hepatica TaxID=6192 RepID=A0A4E0RJE5_FASHE|nr:Subfamily S9B unassigned peptidase (S09 family) [Fasciola hepatica]
MPAVRDGSYSHPVGEARPPLISKQNGTDSKDIEAAKRSGSMTSAKPSELDEPELLANNPQKRNWRGILLALIVIAVISSIIITASILTTPREHEINYGKTYTFTDMVQFPRAMKMLVYQIKSNHVVYVSPDYDVVAIDLTTLDERMLVSRHDIIEKPEYMGIFIVSPDLSAIVLEYDAASENRNSRLSKIDALLLPHSSSNVTTIEKRIEVGPFPDALEQPHLPFVQWSPQKNFLSFTYNGHIYVHKHPFVSELSEIVNVTKGMPDVDIIYGETDWLYEEELLQTKAALWWNPTATRLAFASFNQKNVSSYYMSRYDGPNDLYGYVQRIKYPKAGDVSDYTNPQIEFFVYDLETGERREFKRPAKIPWDGLLVFTRWYDEDVILVAWTNRIQTEAWITAVSWSRNKSWIIFNTAIQNGWVEMLKETSTEPIVHEPTKSLFIILPRDYSPKAFRGIARLKVDLTGIETRQPVKWVITPEFDITDILHFDGDSHFLFLGTGPDAKNSHVFFGTSDNVVTCLTCGNPNCTYNRAKVSSCGRYFVQECRGPDVPTYILMWINQTRRESGELSVGAVPVRILQDNREFKSVLRGRALARIEYMPLVLRKGTRDQMEVEAKLLLPPELNKSHITKYPLLLYTYGGPGKQMVTTKFSLEWLNYLAATVKVVVATIDGRGAGGRGRLFEQAVYKKLGVVEVEDQLHGLKVLVEQLPFVNASQVGAYGWSYGGFTVGHLLGHPENTYARCGIAVAPVTDFKYYDTAYTERYLGRFNDDPDVYLQTQVGKNAKNMRGKSLLLVHGTADDNVHMINSVALTKQLIRENVDVDVMLYPDANHFIHSTRTREHLYRKMITFLVDCFNKTSIRYHMDLSVKQDF